MSKSLVQPIVWLSIESMHDIIEILVWMTYLRNMIKDWQSIDSINGYSFRKVNFSLIVQEYSR